MYGNNNNKTCPASKEERKAAWFYRPQAVTFQRCKGRIPPCLLPYPCGSLLEEAPRAAGTPTARRMLFLPLTKPGGRGRVLRATDPSQGHQGETRHWQCGAAPPPVASSQKAGGDTKANSRQRRRCWHPFVLAQGEKLGRAHLWSSVCTNENVINIYAEYLFNLLDLQKRTGKSITLGQQTQKSGTNLLLQHPPV